MKKAIMTLSAIVLLAACNPATGPGNKEPINEEPNDPIEEQNYRGNDLNDRNIQNDNMNPNDDNLNRKQFNDGKHEEDQRPNYLGPDIDGPLHNDQYPNGNIKQ